MQSQTNVRSIVRKIATLRFTVHRFRTLREKKFSIQENIKYLHKQREQSMYRNEILTDKMNQIIQRRADIFESLQANPSSDTMNTIDYIIQMEYGLLERAFEEEQMLNKAKVLETEAFTIENTLQELQTQMKEWIQENETLCSSSGIPFSLEQCQKYLEDYQKETV